MNPIEKAWRVLSGAYLRGAPEGAEEKLYFLPDQGSALTIGTLVHGPGATEMIDAAAGRGRDGNSAVFACLMALSMGHIEPPIRVWDRNGGDSPRWVNDSPLQMLLDDPNPHHDDLEIWFWTQWARHLDGNAYLRKVRSGNERSGNVVQLWPISPTLIAPITESGSGNFIDYYKYGYAPGKFERIPPENIVHFRIGIDDRDHRLGLSPLKRLTREVCSDDEATRFADALLRNFGIPGLVVTTSPEANFTEEQATALKQKVRNDFGSDNRGNVGVLSPGADIKQFGFSPEQLNLHGLHDVPETRICAAMGVHPAVAMLGAGLEQTANYASLRAVYEAFTERKLVPTWRMDAAKLNKQLKPDFTDDRDTYVEHDLTDVRSLQEDRNALFSRLNEAVKTGWIQPDEARAEIGLPPLGQTTPTTGTDEGVAPLRVVKDARSIQFKAGELNADMLQALVDLAEPAFQNELEQYFDRQRRSVKRELVSGS